jgi:hypothetical protein
VDPTRIFDGAVLSILLGRDGCTTLIRKLFEVALALWLVKLMTCWSPASFGKGTLVAWVGTLIRY